MDGQDLVRVGCYGGEDETGKLFSWGVCEGGMGGEGGLLQDWGQGGDEGCEDGHGGGGGVVGVGVGWRGRAEERAVMVMMPLWLRGMWTGANGGGFCSTWRDCFRTGRFNRQIRGFRQSPTNHVTQSGIHMYTHFSHFTYDISDVMSHQDHSFSGVH